MELLTNNPTMYLPVLLSLRSVKECLDEAFHEFGIEYDIILGELLKEILSSKLGRFGHNGEGPLGAFKAQVPESRRVDEQAEAKVLHDAHLILVDMIAEIVPRDIHRDTYPHYYANGETFILYVPVEPDSVPQEIRAKLIPYVAIRHFDQ